MMLDFAAGGNSGGAHIFKKLRTGRCVVSDYLIWRKYIVSDLS
jgi:hypothetical protein